ncbi:hypothetical protein Tco_0687922 [Tanacetum coccineum]
MNIRNDPIFLLDKQDGACPWVRNIGFLKPLVAKLLLQLLQQLFHFRRRQSIRKLAGKSLILDREILLADAFESIGTRDDVLIASCVLHTSVTRTLGFRSGGGYEQSSLHRTADTLALSHFSTKPCLPRIIVVQFRQFLLKLACAPHSKSNPFALLIFVVVATGSLLLLRVVVVVVLLLLSVVSRGVLLQSLGQMANPQLSYGTLMWIKDLLHDCIYLWHHRGLDPLYGLSCDYLDCSIGHALCVLRLSRAACAGLGAETIANTRPSNICLLLFIANMRAANLVTLRHEVGAR